MVKKIDIGFDSIDTIIHIADVHIRNLKRHKEYRQVFRKLYKDLSSRNLPKNSIIYLAGDIVHAKTEMSPELIQMVSDLFTNLSKIRPTILIAGNHDCNLNNKSRLDALSPIVDSLNLDNFYYLRDNGIYELGDCAFNVMSVFNQPEDYILSKNIKTDKTKIALYHGSVENAFTDVGFKLPGEVTSDIFNGYDMVLLGDIHKQQYLDKKKSIAYAGSLVCQNWGEHPTNHGYMIWDVKKRKSDFIKIINDYTYITLEIDNGKIINKIDLPKYPRLRIKTCRTEQSELKKILAKIRKQCKISDISIIRTDRLLDQKSGNRNLKDAGIGDVRDPNFQNKLIVDYLERNYSLDDDIIKTIKKINKELNSQLSNIDMFGSVSWKPIKFEFSNMFSYGPDNLVNFEKMKGVYGLFAPNASGKSAMLDALTYCLFDKCSRASHPKGVMNNMKSNFNCKLQFQIDGKDYFIERKGHEVLKGYHKGKFTVKVNFWTLDEKNNEVSLNGEQRYDTNKIINSYIGFYEDFILTSLSVQNNNTGFIDMSQSERKDLLGQFLDINIFDDLYRSANEEIKDVSAILREFKKTDFTQQLADAETDLESSKIKKVEIKKNLKSLEGKIKTIENKITKTDSKLIKIDQVNEDIDSMVSSKENLESEIELINQRLESDEKISETNKDKIETATAVLGEYNIEDVETGYDKLLLVNKEIPKLENEYEKLKIKIAHKLEKLETNSEFDPNCEYCRKRESEYILSANKTKEALDIDQALFEYIDKKINDLKEYSNTNNTIIDDYNKIQKINLLLSTIEKERQIGRIAYYQAKEKRNNIELQLQEINNDIKKYHQNKKDILHNQKQIEILKELRIRESSLNNEKEIIDEALLTVHGSIQVAQTTKNNINESISKASEFEIKAKAYEYYIDSVQRDGIPYELISKTIPIIEEEVNDILAQMVEFKIMFELDGKNINTHIAYDDNRHWPLELTSGMEKFISSLAIRTALVNISNLPRPNFLAIDEGLGNLDSENLNSLFMLFTFLKSQFDFLMIISHLDSVRDVVDNLIDINKNGNFSKISYE